MSIRCVCWLALAGLACEGDPIAGTWRSEAAPRVELTLDAERIGALDLGERFFEVEAHPLGDYRYELEACTFAQPPVEPSCSLNLCEFEDEDDPDDDDAFDSPDFSALICVFDGRRRTLYAN